MLVKEGCKVGGTLEKTRGIGLEAALSFSRLSAQYVTGLLYWRQSRSCPIQFGIIVEIKYEGVGAFYVS